MKRSKSLSDITWAGWHGDTEKAALIAAQKGIGKAAAAKAYRDGEKLKGQGEPCDCPACTAKRDVI